MPFGSAAPPVSFSLRRNLSSSFSFPSTETAPTCWRRASRGFAPFSGSVPDRRRAGSLLRRAISPSGHSAGRFVPADRRAEGLVAPLSLSENLALPSPPGGSSSRGTRCARTRPRGIRTFGIRAASPEVPAGALSGETSRNLSWHGSSTKDSDLSASSSPFIPPAASTSRLRPRFSTGSRRREAPAPPSSSSAPTRTRRAFSAAPSGSSTGAALSEPLAPRNRRSRRWAGGWQGSPREASTSPPTRRPGRGCSAQGSVAAPRSPRPRSPAHRPQRLSPPSSGDRPALRRRSERR